MNKKSYNLGLMNKGSFKSFKRICQGKKLEKQKRDKEWWHAVPRFISIYLTWILVKIPISANVITIFSAIIGFTGLVLIGLVNSFLIILGFIFLYVYFVLDEVDGEVARYKKQTSIQGIFFDEVGHLFIHTGLFFTFGYSIYSITRNELFIILGILTAFFFLGIRIIRRIPLVASSKGDFKKVIIEEKVDSQDRLSKKGFGKKLIIVVRNIITAFCTTIIIVSTYLVGYLFFIIFDNSYIIEFIMIAYTIFMFIMFTSFIFIRSRTVEKDVIRFYNIIIED